MISAVGDALVDCDACDGHIRKVFPFVSVLRRVLVFSFVLGFSLVFLVSTWSVMFLFRVLRSCFVLFLGLLSSDGENNFCVVVDIEPPGKAGCVVIAECFGDVKNGAECFGNGFQPRVRTWLGEGA